MARLVEADLIIDRLMKFKAKALTRWGKEALANVPAMVDGVVRGINKHSVEYRRHTCPHCQHEWLEDRDASDYPNYCPACGEPLGKED